MRLGAMLMTGAAALGLALGCGTAVLSPPAAGAFRLESIGGSPVPVTLTGAVVVVSGSLTLSPDGSVVAETVTRNLTQGDPDVEQTGRSTGTWSRTGDLLTLTMPHGTLWLRVEDRGNRLRTEEIRTTGPGLGVYREYVYLREP